MKEFAQGDLKKLFKPRPQSQKGENGQITIIGGSTLFHGAPLLALKTASRLVDITFFASPEPQVLQVAAQIKSQLSSFIWVPWTQIESYLEKSDAILIGPGLMRYHSNHEHCHHKRVCDGTGAETKKMTENLLKQFPDKQWVIDAGSLQVIDQKVIPPKAILTPNRREFQLLFGVEATCENVCQKAKEYNCVIVDKAPETVVASAEECLLVKGGNAGLTKGGTGDILAGLTVALAVNNSPFMAACAASYLVKKAAERLHQRVGFAYNADDLVCELPHTLGEYWR